MGARVARMEGGPTRAELAAGVQPEQRPLTILQFRFVCCLFGVIIMGSGLFFLINDLVREYSIRSVGPTLMGLGLVLIVGGASCCVIAIKRGEPAIPRKYRLQRVQQHQAQQNTLTMAEIQAQQYQPQYAPPFTTPDSQYPYSGNYGNSGAPSPYGNHGNSGAPSPYGNQGYGFGGAPAYGTGYGNHGNSDDPPPYSAVVGAQPANQNQAFSYT